MFLIDPYRFGSPDVLADVVLLVGFDGTLRDDSPSGHTLTAFGNAAVSGSSPIFGSGSGVFDGSGDYITVPDHADWDWGTGEFTIELWVQFAGSGDRTIISRNNDFVNGSQFDIDLLSGNLRFNATGRVASAAFTPSGSTSYYICAQRVNNVGASTTDYYIHKGTAGGTATVHASAAGNILDNLTFSDSLPISIGRHEGHGGATNDFNGKIDEIRITKGRARYGSGSFAVPSAAFPRTMAFSGVPVISTAGGFYGVGDVLTVADASYSGAISSARQWKADGVDIGGATGTSFTLTSSELGKQITVRQTITAPDASTLHADSAATPAVVNPTYQTDTRIAGSDTRIAGADTRIISTRIA